jgi:hypothetical protein
MSEGKTVSHCPGLTKVWTCCVEPKMSPLCTWIAVIARSSCIGRQGEDCVSDWSRAIAVHSHALWLLQRYSDVWTVNGYRPKSLVYESCLVYLNDVIVLTCTLQRQLLNMRKVLQRFREARLKLKPEKWQFFRRKNGTPGIFCRLGWKTPAARRQKS